MTSREGLKLADLVNINSLDAVFEEISVIAGMLSPDFDAKAFGAVYHDTVSIYNGSYPGYKRCNTDYHDLKHVIEVTLATVRLAHAAHEAGYRFSHFGILILLEAAMMHDTGYIQPDFDDAGTGAKFTLVHVDKSIDFTRRYLSNAGYGDEALDACSVIIKATDLAVKTEDIPFLKKEWEHLAKIMATGDILAQITSRNYIEKLPFLYKEFEEGKVPGFESELDLLKKTLGFYDYAVKRMDNDLGGFRQHLKLHFEKRWGCADDLYQKALNANIKYLHFLLEDHEENYYEVLKRGHVAERLSEIEDE
jgi:hypothetical protein